MSVHVSEGSLDVELIEDNVEIKIEPVVTQDAYGFDHELSTCFKSEPSDNMQYDCSSLPDHYDYNKIKRRKMSPPHRNNAQETGYEMKQGYKIRNMEKERRRENNRIKHFLNRSDIEKFLERKRQEKTKPAQYEIFVQFLEHNKDFTLGKLQAGARKNYMDGKWAELTNLLNSNGLGPKRMAQAWQTIFCSWKNQVKHKARKVSNFAGSAGSQLTEIEKRALEAFDQALSEEEARTTLYTMAAPKPGDESADFPTVIYDSDDPGYEECSYDEEYNHEEYRYAEPRCEESKDTELRQEEDCVGDFGREEVGNAISRQEHHIHETPSNKQPKHEIKYKNLSHDIPKNGQDRPDIPTNEKPRNEIFRREQLRPDIPRNEQPRLEKSSLISVIEEQHRLEKSRNELPRNEQPRHELSMNEQSRDEISGTDQPRVALQRNMQHRIEKPIDNQFRQEQLRPDIPRNEQPRHEVSMNEQSRDEISGTDQPRVALQRNMQHRFVKPINIQFRLEQLRKEMQMHEVPSLEEFRLDNSNCKQPRHEESVKESRPEESTCQELRDKELNHDEFILEDIEDEAYTHAQSSYSTFQEVRPIEINMRSQSNGNSNTVKRKRRRNAETLPSLSAIIEENGKAQTVVLKELAVAIKQLGEGLQATAAAQVLSAQNESKKLDLALAQVQLVLAATKGSDK